MRSKQNGEWCRLQQSCSHIRTTSVASTRSHKIIKPGSVVCQTSVFVCKQPFNLVKTGHNKGAASSSAHGRLCDTYSWSCFCFSSFGSCTRNPGLLRPFADLQPESSRENRVASKRLLLNYCQHSVTAKVLSLTQACCQTSR